MHYCAVTYLSSNIIAHINVNEKYFHKIIQEYFENKQLRLEIFKNINKISRGENVNG